MQAIEHIQELMQLDLPKTSQRALQNYRRRNPRRDPADAKDTNAKDGENQEPTGSQEPGRSLL